MEESQVLAIFDKAVSGENVDKFVKILDNGLNFNLETIENFIKECIDKNNRWLLEKILGSQSIVHFVKPSVTKVKVLKKAIVERNDEELTISLLKALFDLNLEFALETFLEVIDKVQGYIMEHGFVKALNYMIERYDPLAKNEALDEIKKMTEENAKKMIKLKPEVQKWREKEKEFERSVEAEKIIKEEEEFKRKQRERGVIMEKEKKWFNDKRKWNNMTKNKNEEYYDTHGVYKTNSNIRKKPEQIKSKEELGERIDDIIRLSDKGFSEESINEAIVKFNETLGEQLEEMFPTSSKKGYNTESDLINEIVKYKDNGLKPNDILMKEKLKELEELIKKNKTNL